MNHSTIAFAAVSFYVFSGIAVASPSEGSVNLQSVDYAFIGSTYLGNKYQIDTGKLGETHAASQSVRAYAELMDTSHVEVENQLVALLRMKGITQPTLTLLEGAYDTIKGVLSKERGSSFDRDYIKGQIDYQHANADLYRWEIANGKDPDLVAFAKLILPKIEDHRDRAEKLGKISE